MADIAPLLTVEDYQNALQVTLETLEEVLSTANSLERPYADAEQWLDACKRALEEAKRRR